MFCLQRRDASPPPTSDQRPPWPPLRRRRSPHHNNIFRIAHHRRAADMHGLLLCVGTFPPISIRHEIRAHTSSASIRPKDAVQDRIQRKRQLVPQYDENPPVLIFFIIHRSVPIHQDSPEEVLPRRCTIWHSSAPPITFFFILAIFFSMLLTGAQAAVRGLKEGAQTP